MQFLLVSHLQIQKKTSKKKQDFPSGYPNPQSGASFPARRLALGPLLLAGLATSHGGLHLGLLGLLHLGHTTCRLNFCSYRFIHIFFVWMEILNGIPQIKHAILHHCGFQAVSSQIWCIEDKLRHVGMVNCTNTTGWFTCTFGLQIPMHIGDPCNFVGSHCFEARAPCAPRSGFGWAYHGCHPMNLGVCLKVLRPWFRSLKQSEPKQKRQTSELRMSRPQ